MESQLHSLEKAVGSIGLHVSADKTEPMCFNRNQTRDIYTLTGGSLRLADKFTYIGNSVSSTENDINMWLANAWTAIDRLSVFWKTDIPDKIKPNFSKQRSCSHYYIDAPHGRWLSAWKKSFSAIAIECFEPYWRNPGSNIPQNSSVTYLPSLKLFEQDMQKTAGEAMVSS